MRPDSTSVEMFEHSCIPHDNKKVEEWQKLYKNNSQTSLRDITRARQTERGEILLTQVTGIGVCPLSLVAV